MWKHFANNKMLLKCSYYCSFQRNLSRSRQAFQRFLEMLYHGMCVFDLKQESSGERVEDLFLTSKICNPTFVIQVLPAQCPPTAMAPPTHWRLDYDPSSEPFSC